VRYAGAVKELDALRLAPLIAAVEEAGLAASTVVCVAADHGFELLEHGSTGHGDFLWEPLLRGPWVLRGPGVAAGRTVASPVSLVDVAPTLAALLGLPLAGSRDGRDVLAGELPEAPEAFFSTVRPAARGEGRGWDGVRQGPWKLLRQHLAPPLLPRCYLYHVEWDPAEIHDLLEHAPEVGFELRSKLEAHTRPREDLPPVEEELRERAAAWAAVDAASER
jgi:arylsulfatase A-like enzyme